MTFDAPTIRDACFPHSGHERMREIEATRPECLVVFDFEA